MNDWLEKLGARAKAVTAIIVLAGMVISGAAWGASRYVDARIEYWINIVRDERMEAIEDFRTEYKCDKLRAEIQRVSDLPDTPANQRELTRLETIYNNLNCAQYEVF